MAPHSNAQHSGHNSSSPSSARPAAGARMTAGDVYATRGPRPTSSIPVSDTAVSQADGAA